MGIRKWGGHPKSGFVLRGYQSYDSRDLLKDPGSGQFKNLEASLVVTWSLTEGNWLGQGASEENKREKAGRYSDPESGPRISLARKQFRLKQGWHPSRAGRPEAAWVGR